MLVFLISMSLLVSSVALIYVHTSPVPDIGYSEFYLLDIDHTVNDLPNSLSVNESKTFIIGIVSHELDTTTFLVIVDLINATGERQNRTIMDYEIVLGPESMNESNCTFEVLHPGEYELKVELYKQLDQQAYLENHLWLVVG